MKFKTIKELTDHYVRVADCTPGSWWAGMLEPFTSYTSLGKTVAVSRPMFNWEYVNPQMSSLATSAPINEEQFVLVINDWDALCKRVVSDALRERFLVRITGNLSTKTWQKAVEFSGRTDGFIRRSKVGVPTGAPYWYPTPEQIPISTDGCFIRHQADYSQYIR